MPRTSVAHTFDRLVSWLRPDQALPREVFERRFLVGTSLVFFFAGLVSFVGVVATGDFRRGLLSIFVTLIVSLPALLVRFGVSARTLLTTQLAFIGALLTLNALLPQQFETISLTYLTIMPMLALLGLGPARAVVAFVVAAGLALGVILAHMHGLQLGLLPGNEPATLFGDFTGYLVFASIFTSLAFLFNSLRERAVADAERATRARGLFLANISHELRTPMNGVVGMTDLLARSSLSEEQREQVEVIRRSGEALVTLINDLLDYTKLESGNVKLEALPFSASELLTDTVSLFRPLAERKNLTLVGQVHPNVPPGLLGDPVRVKQILQNLVSNAIKFTSRGTVEVVVSWVNDRLELSVSDQGIGIGDDTARLLFRPFTQGDVSTTRRFGGTGLGLAICHQLATQMGGAIELDSARGRGSRFLVRLPLEPCAPPITAERSGSHPVARAPGAPRRALVVEDNHINQVVLTSMLVREGFTCTVAENGQVALELLARATPEAPYAIVFMDCQMPVMDGYETTRRLRELAGPIARVPVIAVTASAMSEDVDRCLACGMDAVITKPVTLGSLRPMLAQFANAPRPAAVTM